MQAQELVREFKHGSVKLTDPNSSFSVGQVRDFYSAHYPELLNAEVEGPELSGNKQIYTFRRAVGTKGLTTADAIALLKQNGSLNTPKEKLKEVTVNSTFAQALGRSLAENKGAVASVSGSVNVSVLP